MQAPSKGIPANRDRFQSQMLVWVVGVALCSFCIFSFRVTLTSSPTLRSLSLTCGLISLTFAGIVWALRAATGMGAICGGMICYLLSVWTSDSRHTVLHSALTPLMVLFVLTFAATRIGKRSRPEFTSAAEKRHGRRASQVIANLGFSPIAILVAMTNVYDRVLSGASGVVSISGYLAPALVLAALAEATADTVSSELGQAFGGTPWLITSLRRAPAGTDGAVSLLGTAAGIIAAGIVTAAGTWSMHLDERQALAALAGGVAGLLFDSLLGATVERRGWMNNDLVNFSSTVFAAGIALLLLAV